MICPSIPNNEDQRLEALERYELLDGKPDPVLDDLTRLAAQVVGSPVALASLVYAHRQWFKSSYGIDIQQAGRDESFCGHVVASCEELIVADTHEDERFHDNPLVVGGPKVRFYAGVPLTTPDGYCLGTLCVIDSKPRTLAPEPLEALRALARQVMRRLEARREAQRSAYYQQLFEQANSLAAVLDWEGNFLHVNPAWEETLGYAESEMIGRSFKDLVHPDDLEKTIEIAKAKGEGGELAHFENRYITKDGDARWLSWSGKITDGVLFTTAIDITERKLAAQHADDSETRLRAVFDHVVDGLLTLDDEAIIQSVNPAASAIFGYETDELLGKSLWSLVDRPDADSGPAPLLAMCEPRGHGMPHELEGHRKSGRDVPVELAISWMRVDGTIMYTGIVRDITERKEIERLKNEFISVVSHELRTPLTSIRGSLRLIEGGVAGQIPDKALDLVEVASRNTERLVRLINDILDIEKMESGRVELELEELEAESLLAYVIDGLDGMAEEQNISLEEHVDYDCLVRADRDRMVQVLTNLVSNAIKFSPDQGKVELRITDTGKGSARFSVRDYGVGISVEDQRKLFQKFSQLDSTDARDMGGTGLGLAISKQIVEQHGGRIGIESTPGEGAEFWFEIDAEPRRGATGDFGLECEPEPEPGEGHDRLERTGDDSTVVLIVEDDLEVSGAISEDLQAAGYTPLTCNSIADAERALRSVAVDVVLLDLNLPDGDGLELLERMRTTNEYGWIPVVVITGRDRKRAGYGNSLLVDWLPKPLEASKLRAAVDAALERRERPSVLVVEDDPSSRRVIVELLEQLGVSCMEAMDGRAAVEVALQNPPDLLILDVGLPVADGFEVVETLKQRGMSSIPTVIYTGRDLTKFQREELSLGLTRCLTKLLTTEEDFLEAARSLLERAAPRPRLDRRPTTKRRPITRRRRQQLPEETERIRTVVL